MQNNFNNPYNNPYGYPYNNFYQQPQVQQQPKQYAFVNGIEGAKSYQVQPGQMVMLLDSDNPIVYKKTANPFGQATIEYFKLVSVNENELRGTNTQPNIEYATKAEFEALVKRIEELNNLVNKDGDKNA